MFMRCGDGTDVSFINETFNIDVKSCAGWHRIYRMFDSYLWL